MTQDGIFVGELAAARERIADLERRLALTSRHGEAQLRAIVDNMPGGSVYLFDRDLRFARAGGMAFREAGLIRAMVEGHTLFEIFPPEVCAGLVEFVPGVFEGREFCTEVDFAGRVFSVHVAPVRDDEGAITHGLAFTMDCTERKQAEAELRLHAERYRILTENVEDIIWAMDEEARVTFISPSVTRVLGYAMEDIEGQSLTTLMPPDTLRVFSAVRDARRVREARGEYDTDTKAWRFELLHKDGSLVWTETLTTPIRAANGKYLGLIGITRDATAQVRIQQALELAKDAAVSASRAKSEFLANMSHEIRTPLNGIMGMLQLLQSTPLNAEQSEFVETALASSRGLLGVIGDILDYSRMEAGKIAITADWFDPRQMVESVFGSFQAQVREKNIALTAEIATNTPGNILADPTRVRQILTNLIGNAVKFTPAGRIEVALSVTPTSEGDVSILHVQIRDTGIGIPQNARDSLFEPFVQVDGSLTRHYQGSGLGLSIVRRLLTLMGGSVELRSTESRGTEVCFSLPVRVRSERQEARTEPVSVASKVVGRGVAILLVDDDRFSEKMLGTLLRGRGFTVTGVYNGRQALDELRARAYDAVIMDIQMPELDGLTATRIIRTDPDFAHVARIPLVALTAHAMHGDRDKFLAAGMDAYLAKPVNMRELLDVVEMVVKRRGV